MRQNDDNKKSKDKAKASSDFIKQDKENWLDEHGHPSNKFLQSLANNNNMEKLRSIASDLDVDFGPNATVDELVGAIRSATGSTPNTTT